MRKKQTLKFICFDMDGVLVKCENYREKSRRVGISTWNVIFDELGIYEEHERLKKMFINGKFASYMNWTEEACKILKNHGLTKSIFERIIKERPLTKGARETITKLKEMGYKIAVITGSFHSLAERIKKELNLDYAIAHCKLIFSKNGKLKSWKLLPCDFEGKLVYFNKLINKLGLQATECVYIGDEVNDIPIFKEVGLAIAFNPRKKEVRKAADIVINSNDLRDILPYLR